MCNQSLLQPPPPPSHPPYTPVKASGGVVAGDRVWVAGSEIAVAGDGGLVMNGDGNGGMECGIYAFEFWRYTGYLRCMLEPNH